MRLTARRNCFLFCLIFSLCMACEEDEVTTTFHGTVTRNSDSKPATNIKLTFTGLHSSGGLWPSMEEVSSHVVVTDSKGEFSITIPENSEIDYFRLRATTLSSDHIDIISGCAHFMCESFEPGKTSEVTLVVGL
jgi:hypothetical protein